MEQMWWANLQGFVIQGIRTDSGNTVERSGITCKPGHRYDSWDLHSAGWKTVPSLHMAAAFYHRDPSKAP